MEGDSIINKLCALLKKERKNNVAYLLNTSVVFVGEHLDRIVALQSKEKEEDLNIFHEMGYRQGYVEGKSEILCKLEEIIKEAN